jgi:hypothetical protein
MKKQCVCLFFINLFLLFSVTASVANVEVVSVLGYVEIRRQGHNYWEVAKKGMALSDEDLVRIPPKATFRVRLESGDAVYFVPGQERLAKDLAPSEKRRIVDGRARSSKAANMFASLTDAKGLRFASSTFRFAERSRQVEHQIGNSALPSLMTNQHVDFLLSTLEEDANNKIVRDLARSVLEYIPITTNTGYPNRNIVRAQHLLDMLRGGIRIKSSDNLFVRLTTPDSRDPARRGIPKVLSSPPAYGIPKRETPEAGLWSNGQDNEQSVSRQASVNSQPTKDIQSPSKTLENRQGNDFDVARLYLALLNAAGVEAKPRGDNNVPLFIVFNSNIPAGEAQSITVNKKLYVVENDTVWFPIQITSSTDNFIKAWYRGSEKCSQGSPTMSSPTPEAGLRRSASNGSEASPTTKRLMEAR